MRAATDGAHHRLRDCSNRVDPGGDVRNAGDAQRLLEGRNGPPDAERVVRSHDHSSHVLASAHLPDCGGEGVEKRAVVPRLGRGDGDGGDEVGNGDVDRRHGSS